MSESKRSQKKIRKIFLLRNRKKKFIFFSSKISKSPKVGTVLGPFGPKKGQRDFFLKNLIRPLFTPYMPLDSCKKSEKTNDSIFIKVSKTSFWACFGPFFAQKRANGLFSEKSGSVSFHHLWSPDFMQKIRKK